MVSRIPSSGPYAARSVAPSEPQQGPQPTSQAEPGKPSAGVADSGSSYTTAERSPAEPVEGRSRTRKADRESFAKKPEPAPAKGGDVMGHQTTSDDLPPGQKPHPGRPSK